VGDRLNRLSKRISSKAFIDGEDLSRTKDYKYIGPRNEELVPDLVYCCLDMRLSNDGAYLTIEKINYAYDARKVLV
jgi:hypothetical protein